MNAETAAATSFRTRLNLIVDAVFGGNTVAAAAAAGVSQPTVYRLLHGQTAEPRENTVRRLAAAYRVAPEWLTGTVERLPEEEPPLSRSPTWLVLIDRFYDPITTGASAPGSAAFPARRAPAAAELLYEIRERASGAVFEMLALLESAHASLADERTAMVAYRAIRELEATCLRHLQRRSERDQPRVELPDAS